MLPEIAVGGMQEPCGDQQFTASSPSLEIKQEPPDISPSHWIPEHFLQSTLHEGNGVVCFASPSDEITDEKFSAQIKGRQKQNPKVRKERRKQQWKLKFHHQALPPEYLDHYEASLSKKRSMEAPSTHITSSGAQTDLPPVPFIDINGLSRETVLKWQQKGLQNGPQKGIVPIGNIQSSPSRPKRNVLSQNDLLSCPPSKVVNYKDLPYMGEMTLNNSKPRRGRKPKKADICHLIYKNYGTIFPGTPVHLVDDKIDALNSDKGFKCETGESMLNPTNKHRTDIQNKIISSLLEKRLSQENRKRKEVKLKKNKCAQIENEASVEKVQTSVKDGSTESPDLTEPLNLCVRDLNNLKIRLLRKHGNVYTKANVGPKVELDRSEDETCVALDEKSQSNVIIPISVPERKSVSPKLEKTPSIDIPLVDNEISPIGSADRGSESPLPGGYVFWPNAGVFMHPLALQSQLLYYQGLTAGSSYTVPPESIPDSPNSSKPDRATPQSVDLEQRKSPAESSETSTTSAKNKRVANSRNTSLAPPKRKRSAIFIPPVPAENTSSPATEVSICKFKFTGGARPSLQEKKMLSVDAGGNFRYYSGTGDKANRGYEFFPRESLQQSVGGGVGVAAGGVPLLPSPAIVSEDSSKKKRKSRKSLQREKLEKTFKEKGFLIQTQQLESAEGATYCKFRQLTKFTRYLFRSWKDYLPGMSQEGDNGALPVAAITATPVDPVGVEWT